jgi:pilus assembly protein CpaD
MLRLGKLLPVLLIGTAVSACSNDIAEGNEPAFISNRSLYSENQPVVERTNYVFDVTTGAGGLSNPETIRLADWFDSLQLRYGDRIFVDDSASGSDARADVAKVAAAYGLLLSDGAPVTAGMVQPGSARVIVTRATASVPGCPNWRQAKLSGAAISTESNFGCATNSNLAAMIANPEDLVLGQEGVPSGDAATASKAIKTYRDAAPSGAGGIKAVSTTGGGN